jgi:hypothetical protein
MMENALIMSGSLALVVGVFVLLDWLQRRKDRMARQDPSAKPS